MHALIWIYALGVLAFAAFFGRENPKATRDDLGPLLAVSFCWPLIAAAALAAATHGDEAE